MSVNAGPNSLVMLPVGFDPDAAFKSYSNLGMTHVAGTTLSVSAGQGFSGSGAINDPVNCQGTISASPSGIINLTGGLNISGTGTVSLGGGTLTVNDAASGMTGGSLTTSTDYIGVYGVGVFTQSGGTHTISGPYGEIFSALVPAPAAPTTSTVPAS